MAHISPGVVIINKFCTSTNKVFSEYINYIDREDAIRNNKIQSFNLYNDYMENPEKSSGLFTDDKDKLTQNEKQIVKDIFQIAQNNGSFMWQTVISFDNKYLEENGLYDKESGFLNEDKIHELTRGAVGNILKEENMDDSAFWTASIHYNTDNIHIHIAIVEQEPQRAIIKTGKYAGQRKGTFKQNSLRAAKRFVVNYILENQIDNDRINKIIRDNIIANKKEHPLYKDKEFTKEFMRIHDRMPKNKKLWNYGMNSLNYIRPDLDGLISLYLNKYHSAELKELKELLKKYEEIYQRSYGKSKNNYAQNKIDDLYKRLGNVILKEMKNYDKELKKNIHQETERKNAETGQKMDQKQLAIYSYSSDETKNNTSSVKDDGFNMGSYKKNDIKFRHKSSCKCMIGAVEGLKRSMRDEIQHTRNEYEFEMQQRSKERELEKEKNSEFYF